MNFFNYKHTWRATLYSWQGLCHAIKSEQAVRHIIVILFLLLGLLLYFRTMPFVLLLLAWLLVLALELLNTALERLCDLISPEYNLLIKQAKDLASAATAVIVAGNVLLWIYLTITWLFN